MITIKILCSCGQKYAFDAEPLNGRLANQVICPVCGADGTAAANEIIAGQISHAPPAPALSVSPAHSQPPQHSVMPPPSGASFRRAGSNWVLPVGLAVLAIVMAGGGFAAWKFSKSKGESTPAPPQTSTDNTVPASDHLPQTLAELNSWYVTPPEGQNAATVLLQAFDAIDLTGSNNLPYVGNGARIAPGAPIPAAIKPALTSFIQQNEKVWSLLEKSFGMNSSRYPIDMTLGADMTLPHLAKIRLASKMALLYAISKADAGQEADAAQAVTFELALANSQANEPLLLSQLNRIACEHMALDGLEQVVNRVKMSEGILEAINDDFRIAEMRESAGDSMTRGIVGERVTAHVITQSTP